MFAEKAWNGATDGLLFGNPAQLGIQALAVLATIVYSGAMTVVLLKLVNLVVPIRATAQDEGLGMDVSQHGEEAYANGEGAILLLPERPPIVPALGSAGAAPAAGVDRPSIAGRSLVPNVQEGGNA